VSSGADSQLLVGEDVEKYAQITLYKANQNHTARRKAHYDNLTAYAYTKRKFPTVLGVLAPPIYVGKVG